MIDIPPGRYFISHSYKDEVIRNEMIKQLPDGVVPFIFPPISVTPMEFVSNTLVGAILACDGMIYLNEGASSQSFWVAFERDYALRSGKPVYAYTPSRRMLAAHDASPLDLAVFLSYRHDEFDEIRPILDFMRQSRYFNVWTDKSIVTGTNWVTAIKQGSDDILRRGGYVLMFTSERESKFVKAEAEYGLRANRVIVAGIGDRRPGFMQEFQHEYVQLKDGGRINHNRVDDLIVRLYWLIFRNQFPELVYE